MSGSETKNLKDLLDVWESLGKTNENKTGSLDVGTPRPAHEDMG